MAVTITDRRTTVTSAENTTGWTGVGFGTTTARAEGANAVAEAYNIGDGATYFTGGSVNLGTSPGTLVYVYSFNNALQTTWNAATPPNALLLGDGTDRIAFKMAGSDRRVFNHLDGPTEWQCLVLDTGQASAMNTAGNAFAAAGSFGALNFAAITQWGVYFATLSKALGGGYNCAVDIIRYGNDGIRITAGGSGTEGKFSEIATGDRSIATGAAHGILRAYTTIAFGAQGPMTFGNSGAATVSRFIDSGAVVVFEARNIGNDKYYLNVEGNAGTTNVFELRASTITTAGPFVSMTMGSNINTLVLTGNTFSLGGNVSLPTDTAHTVTGNTFQNCGTVSTGAVDFDDNTVSGCGQVTIGTGTFLSAVVNGYEGTANTSAVIYNQAVTPDGVIDGSRFTKGTAATHAIEFGLSTPTTMTLRDINFSGYSASNNVNDSMLHIKRTTGTVTINLIGVTVNGGAGTVTYRTDGATVSLVAASSLELTGLKNPSEVRVYDAGTTTEIAGQEDVTTGTFSTSIDSATYPSVDISILSLGFQNFRLLNISMATDRSIPISQVIDRQYLNP